VNLTCKVCGCAFLARRGAKACSGRCRKALSRSRKDTWECLHDELTALGEAAAASLLESDKSFRVYAREIYRGHSDAEQSKKITKSSGPRGVVLQRTLASETLIDDAETSGDWSLLLSRSRAMLAKNADILGWGNGYGSGDNPLGKPLPLIDDDPVRIRR
jgi:hypothetical protein